MLTARDIYERVSAHLLTQRAVSEDDNGSCRLRSSDGRKCAIGSLIAGTIASRLIRAGRSIEKVRKGSLLVAALLATPLPFADTVHSYALAVALIGLVMAGHQAFSVNLFALIADVSRPEKIGRVTSFGAFSGNVGGMVIAKVAGLTLAAGFGYWPLFLFAGFSYLLALGAIQLLLPRLPLDGMGTPLPAGRH